MGEISVLSENGDDKIFWDANSKEEIEKAKKQFDELKKKDYTFFELYHDGKQGKAVKEFDETIEWIIAVPPTRKG